MPDCLPTDFPISLVLLLLASFFFSASPFLFDTHSRTFCSTHSTDYPESSGTRSLLLPRKRTTVVTESKYDLGRFEDGRVGSFVLLGVSRILQPSNAICCFPRISSTHLHIARQKQRNSVVDVSLQRDGWLFAPVFLIDAKASRGDTTDRILAAVITVF